MEQRALVILYTGNDLTDNALEKICKTVSQTAFAHPQDVSMYCLNQEDLAKLIARQIMKDHTPVEQKSSFKKAVDMLSKEYPLNNDVALTIHLGRTIPEIYGRIKYGKAIQHDVDTVNNIRLLITNSIYDADVAKEYHLTKNTVRIVNTIFNTFFDEKGNAR